MFISKEIANKKKNTNQNKERITELQNKEKEYLNKLDVLYEDKFRGIVSEETYKRIASETEKLRLKRNVYFMLDEFANLPKIEKMDSLITVGRSRGIFFSLVVQSYSQLESKYGKEVAEIVRGQCRATLF